MTLQCHCGSFKDLERDAWDKRAPYYHDRLAQMTKQATIYMLDAIGARPGMNLLDACCGSGQASDEASRRGLSVVGVDIAAGMIKEAQRLFPNAQFCVGDAEALHFA